MTQMPPKNYEGVLLQPSFEDRITYLQLPGVIAEITFGQDRYLNQMLYRSRRWKQLRSEIIVRDNGCDLAIPGLEIYSHAIVHHIEPITLEDIEKEALKVFDPNNLITCSLLTHNIIHYGTGQLVEVERRPNDTAPWRL